MRHRIIEFDEIYLKIYLFLNNKLRDVNNISMPLGLIAIYFCFQFYFVTFSIYLCTALPYTGKFSTDKVDFDRKPTTFIVDRLCHSFIKKL